MRCPSRQAAFEGEGRVPARAERPPPRPSPANCAGEGDGGRALRRRRCTGGGPPSPGPLPRFAGRRGRTQPAHDLRSSVARARDGQSPQGDFVCSLQRIHSPGWGSATEYGTGYRQRRSDGTGCRRRQSDGTGAEIMRGREDPSVGARVPCTGRYSAAPPSGKQGGPGRAHPGGRLPPTTPAAVQMREGPSSTREDGPRHDPLPHYRTHALTARAARPGCRTRCPGPDRSRSCWESRSGGRRPASSPPRPPARPPAP